MPAPLKLPHPIPADAIKVFCKSISRELQRRRLLLGLTQSELAEAAGISLKYVGEVERGEGNIRLQTLAKIAVALQWPSLASPAEKAAALDSIMGALTTEVQALRGRLVAVENWIATLAPDTPPLEAPPAQLPTKRPRVGKLRP